MNIHICSSIQGIDGEWQEWGDWSECDPSCNCGNKFRARECRDPVNGGKDCVGESTETEPCSPGCCSTTVSRIRTLESPFLPSCQNDTTIGKQGSFSRLALIFVLRKQQCQFHRLLRQRVHVPQRIGDRQLLPREQHVGAGRLWAWCQLCGNLLSSGSCSLSIGELFR